MTDYVLIHRPTANVMGEGRRGVVERTLYELLELNPGTEDEFDIVAIGCETCDGTGCPCMRSRDWWSMELGCECGCAECGLRGDTP